MSYVEHVLSFLNPFQRILYIFTLKSMQKCIFHLDLIIVFIIIFDSFLIALKLYVLFHQKITPTQIMYHKTLQENSLLTAFFFLLIGNSSILSSPSSETYSYSSLTGLGFSSLMFCIEPKTLKLLWVLSVFDLRRPDDRRKQHVKKIIRYMKNEVFKLLLEIDCVYIHLKPKMCMSCEIEKKILPQQFLMRHWKRKLIVFM